MFLPRIDANGFLDAVANAPLIAFQALPYGYAVAAPQNFAFYAPMTHPGGGNLDNSDNKLCGSFTHQLGGAFLSRAGKPALRTLRPTAKPIVTVALTNYLGKIGGGEILSFDDAFKKASGDDPTVVDFSTQVVIQAIEEHGRPDLQATTSGLKREAMIEALERVQEQAAAGLEAVEGTGGPKVTLHLMQCAAAVRFALELLLRP